MEGKRKAAGETILCHPRLVDGTFCYVISSFVSTSSPKKGTVRPWATRNASTSCTLPRERKHHPAVSFVVAIAIQIPFFSSTLESSCCGDAATTMRITDLFSGVNQSLLVSLTSLLYGIPPRLFLR